MRFVSAQFEALLARRPLAAKRPPRERDGGPARRRGRAARRGRDHPPGRGQRGLRPPRRGRRSTGCSRSCPASIPFYVWDEASRRGALDVRLGHAAEGRRRVRRRGRLRGRLTFEADQSWIACASWETRRRTDLAERIETAWSLAGSCAGAAGAAARRPRRSRSRASSSTPRCRLALRLERLLRRVRGPSRSTSVRAAPPPRRARLRRAADRGRAGRASSSSRGPPGRSAPGSTARRARRPGAADRLLPRRRARDLRPRHPRSAVPLPRPRDPGAGALGRLPARPRAPLPGRGRRLARGLRVGARRGRASSAPTRSGSRSPATAPAATWPTVVAQLARRGRRPGAGVPGADLPGHRLLVEAAVVLRPSREGFFLTREEMDWFRDNYFADRGRPHRPARLADPRRRPRAASRRPTWSPPASTRCATRARTTPRRLRDAGRAVTLRREPDLVHGFINAVGLGGRSREAMRSIARAIREGLA